MTTIAWDGRTLAGDKQTNLGTLPIKTTKVKRIGDLLVGGCGDTHRILEMHEWLANGRKKDEFPAFQRGNDDSVVLIVIEDGQCWHYGVSHVPVLVEDAFSAIGSGRDFATMAMHLGKTAAEAVALASIYDTGSGLGVDEVSMV